MIRSMGKVAMIARLLDGDQLECQITTHQGRQLTLTGNTADIEPTIEGDDDLHRNRALTNNAWAYSKFTFQKVHLPTPD